MNPADEVPFTLDSPSGLRTMIHTPAECRVIAACLRLNMKVASVLGVELNAEDRGLVLELLDRFEGER